jgi:hypothetical protein
MEEDDKTRKRKKKAKEELEPMGKRERDNKQGFML